MTKKDSQLIIYQAKDGQTKLQVKLEKETVWLTQAQICQLFGKSKATISEHIKHIFEEKELDQNSYNRDKGKIAWLAIFPIFFYF